MTDTPRLSTGIDGLDDLLGGGLLPGTLTAVVGSTGIGKTQFGLQFAQAGLEQEGRRGILFDMCARGDSQNHADYARRMFGWELQPVDPERHLDLDRFYSPARPRGDYLHVFDQHGRRVTRADLDFDAWHQWQAELARRLNGRRSPSSTAISWTACGGRWSTASSRSTAPATRSSSSCSTTSTTKSCGKTPEWVARDLFREHFRQNAEAAARHVYDPGRIGCMLLITSSEDDARRPDRAAPGRGRRVEQRQHGDPSRQDSRGHPFPPRDVRHQASRQRLHRRNHPLLDR